MPGLTSNRAKGHPPIPTWAAVLVFFMILGSVDWIAWLALRSAPTATSVEVIGALSLLATALVVVYLRLSNRTEEPGAEPDAVSEPGQPIPSGPVGAA